MLTARLRLRVHWAALFLSGKGSSDDGPFGEFKPLPAFLCCRRCVLGLTRAQSDCCDPVAGGLSLARPIGGR